MARRPLSSDLALEPITAPSGTAILDMVEDAAEEIFDTVPGTSRAALETEAARTAEMDKELLSKLLPRTRPTTNPETVAMRPPRPEEPTQPEMPTEAAPEPLIAHAEPRSGGMVLKIVVGVAVFALAATALWFFGP